MPPYDVGPIRGGHSMKHRAEMGGKSESVNAIYE